MGAHGYSELPGRFLRLMLTASKSRRATLPRRDQASHLSAHMHENGQEAVCILPLQSHREEDIPHHRASESDEIAKSRVRCI